MQTLINTEEKMALFLKNSFIFTLMALVFPLLVTKDYFITDYSYVQLFVITLSITSIACIIHKAVHRIFSIALEQISEGAVVSMFLFFIIPASALVSGSVYAITMNVHLSGYALFLMLMSTVIRQMNLAFIVNVYRETLLENIEKV